MEYFIGGIIAIIIIVAIGLFLRKKLYDSVDYYEQWKLDIMNRDVAAEIARVKALNLEGETKEQFETWRESWDNILTKDLANVEELLYDAEKAADRYNFPNAKKITNKMDTILTDVEEKIDVILTDLQHLIATEESNRAEIESIEPRIEEVKSHLAKHHHQYEQAQERFDTVIKDMQEQTAAYHEQIEEGNYGQGSEIIQNLRQQIDQLEEEAEDYPVLHHKCCKELPQQLHELTQGLTEMKEQGYILADLQIEEEITQYADRLSDLAQELEREGVTNVRNAVFEIEERITEMYDVLEEEVLARKYVEKETSVCETRVEQLVDAFSATEKEVTDLKQAYYLEEADDEQFSRLFYQVDQLNHDTKRFLDKAATNMMAYSNLKQDLEVLYNKQQALQEEHKDFKARLQNLRQDEMDARDSVQALQEDIVKMNRKIRSSNIPQVPAYIWGLADEVRHKNDLVLEALTEQPLDMVHVQQLLEDAETAMNTTNERADAMLDQAYLTEHVIQYANRYRSSYQELAVALTESENLFRKAEYELALEKAARALEAVEPGALKKVEKYQEQTVS